MLEQRFAITFRLMGKSTSCLDSFRLNLSWEISSGESASNNLSWVTKNERRLTLRKGPADREAGATSASLTVWDVHRAKIAHQVNRLLMKMHSIVTWNQLKLLLWKRRHHSAAHQHYLTLTLKSRKLGWQSIMSLHSMRIRSNWIVWRQICRISNSSWRIWRNKSTSCSRSAMRTWKSYLRSIVTSTLIQRSSWKACWTTKTLWQSERNSRDWTLRPNQDSQYMSSISRSKHTPT